MRILQINTVSGVLSTGRMCTDMADMYSLSGHECKIAYGRKKCPDKYDKYSIRIGTCTDVAIHAIQSRVLDNAGFGSYTATKRLVEKISAFNPDVVHLHNLHGYYINIEVLFEYLRSVDKQVIWTLHDCWAFTGHCTHFDFVDCNRWKTGCCNCPQKSEYPASYLLDRSASNFSQKKELFTSVKDLCIVTPSNWLADLVRQSYLSKYPISVIHNGIDTNEFRPTSSDFRKKWGLVDKYMVLGVASEWSDRKGLSGFFQLPAMLDDRYRIALVGLNKEQMHALPPNIIGIEKTNSTTELAAIYTAADVYVNLTLEDTYPTTNLEAISCGTPVATYNTGGSPESVPDFAGIVVLKGDVIMMRDAIETLVNADNENFRKSRVSYARDNFSRERQCGEYLSLLNAIHV